MPKNCKGWPVEHSVTACDRIAEIARVQEDSPDRPRGFPQSNVFRMQAFYEAYGLAVISPAQGVPESACNKVAQAVRYVPATILFGLKPKVPLKRTLSWKHGWNSLGSGTRAGPKKAGHSIQHDFQDRTKGEYKL